MADKTMMRDEELRTALEGANTAIDPKFRVAVVQRICDRARRRALAERAAVWIAAGIAIGWAAQVLTPGAAMPGLEAVAMAASLCAVALLLAEASASGPDRLADRLQEFLSR